MTIATLDKEFAEQKLLLALRLSKKIAAGDWPYLDSRLALDAIISDFESKLTELRGLRIDDGDDVVASCCADCRNTVARCHTLIGVILRSSNVRNAFEGFAPMRYIASKLIGPDYRVIFSSEWSYTPFAYPIPISSLEKFIFIGMPACEADNSLLLPLAGHEIGHALWRQTNQEDVFKPQIRSELFRIYTRVSSSQNELFPNLITEEDFERDFKARSGWKRAYEFAVRHCEEVFCDSLACWLFGEGFSHAFRYMVYPELSPRADEYYPTNMTRARYIETALSKFHSVGSSLSSFFTPDRLATNEDLRFADAAVAEVVPNIQAAVDALCAASGLAKPCQVGENKAFTKLEALTPANARTTGDIVNAGWRLRLNLNAWRIPGTKDSRKLAIIDDLVLKSLEINEWKRIHDFKHE